MNTARKTIPIALSALVFIVDTAAAMSPLDSLGLKPGTDYARARAELLHQGWQLEAQEPEEASTYREAPEVACGHGRDAVCSVRFLKNGRAIMLTLRPEAGRLTLVGAEDDR